MESNPLEGANEKLSEKINLEDTGSKTAEIDSTSDSCISENTLNDSCSEILNPPEGEPIIKVENETDPEQTNEVSTISLEEETKPKKKLSKGVIIGIAAGAVAVIAILAIVVSLNQANQRYNDCIDYLTEISSSGLSAASAAENLCNTTKRVWNSAIWNSSKAWDSDIEKYKSDDFNDALTMLYSDTTTKVKIVQMKADYDNAEAALKKLKNPPKELEDAYKAAKTFVSDVNTLVDLAADPSGSLNSYSSEVSSADITCAKSYKALIIEIPEKH